VAIFDVFENVVNAIVNFISGVINVIADIVTSALSIVASIILALFGLIEQVILGIIDIITGILDAIFGTGADSISEDAFNEDTAKLKVESASRMNNILELYGELKTDIAADDEIGFTEVLTASEADIVTATESISNFLTTVSEARSEGMSVEITPDTVNEILALITGLINTILSLILGIITSVIGILSTIVG